MTFGGIDCAALSSAITRLAGGRIVSGSMTPAAEPSGLVPTALAGPFTGSCIEDGSRAVKVRVIP